MLISRRLSATTNDSTVHAEDGQQQREPGECAEQLRQESRPATRLI
jgi:hypothetical protein